MRKYAAEFLGTFGLTTAVLLSLNNVLPVVPTAVVAALTLGLFVYTVGHISGTHLNPAITLAILSIRRISLKDASVYIFSQFLGSVTAFIVASQLFPVSASFLIRYVPDSLAVGRAEFLGAFFFAFGVAAVVFGRVPLALNGVIVGGSLLLGISIAATASDGILNPAVALGIGSLSLMYVLGPVVGAVLGMWIFKLVSEYGKPV